MKVLFISLGTRSGTAQYPAQLANELVDYVDIHVLTPVNSEIENLYNKKVNLHQIHSYQKSGWSKYAHVYIEIIKAVSNIKPDILHLPFYNKHEIALFTLSLFDCPIISTVHDPISHSGMDFNVVEYGFLTKARAISSYLFDQVIVHGKDCEEQAIAAGYNPEQITSLPHGLYESFLENGKQKSNTKYSRLHNLDGPNFLFFGEMRRNKGYDRIPYIMDIVREQYPSAKALVAGPTDTLEDPSLIDQLKDHEGVLVFDEYIPISEVQPFFETADVTVLPYYDGTASGVAMLAYTFSTPVVTTDVGSIGTMIRDDHTGIVASHNSPEKIASAMLDIITNKELLNEFKESFPKSRKKYEWSSIAKETKQIYSDLLNE